MLVGISIFYVLISLIWAFCLLGILDKKIKKYFDKIPALLEVTPTTIYEERAFFYQKAIFWKKVKAIYILTFPISCLLSFPIGLFILNNFLITNFIKLIKEQIRILYLK
jgi:hypothetical protein